VSINPIKAQFAKLAEQLFEHGSEFEGEKAPWCRLEAYPVGSETDAASVDLDRLLRDAGVRSDTHDLICRIRPRSQGEPWGVLLLQKSCNVGTVYPPYQLYMTLAARAGVLLQRLPSSVIQAMGKCLEDNFNDWGYEPNGYDRAWTALAWYVSQLPGQREKPYHSSTAIYVNPFLASADFIHLCGLDTDEPTFPPGLKQRANESVKRNRPKGARESAIFETISGLLLHHHGYDCGSCTNVEPISVREMARRVAKETLTGGERSFTGSVSRYFHKNFDGHASYQRICRDKSSLIARLVVIAGDTKALNRWSSNVDPDDLPDPTSLRDEQRRQMPRGGTRRRPNSDD
jgi:hypothetical protein